MEEQHIGWIAAIIIGGIAGWLAEQFMKSQMGLFPPVCGNTAELCRRPEKEISPSTLVAPCWAAYRA
jgi:hypothetical protein